MFLFFDKVLNKFVLIIIILALFLSLYCIYDSYQIYEESVLSEELKNYDPIINRDYENPNIIGWLRIDNTIIDYPILQGNNNTDYLNLNYKNEYSSSGSIFLDYRNNKNFKDDFSIIYGHNTSYKAMFSELKNYKNYDYLKKNKTCKLFLKSETYIINIILYKEIGDRDDIPYNLYLYKNNYNDLIFKTLMNKKGNSRKMLLLSTCKNGQRNKRIVLLSELKKYRY